LITPSLLGLIQDLLTLPSSSSSISLPKFFFPLPFLPLFHHLESLSFSKLSIADQNPIGPPEVKVYVSPFENFLPFLPNGLGGEESA